MHIGFVSSHCAMSTDMTRKRGTHFDLLDATSHAAGLAPGVLWALALGHLWTSWRHHVDLCGCRWVILGKIRALGLAVSVSDVYVLMKDVLGHGAKESVQDGGL